jgi:putative inorganic carbon (hco3(-)) transporter
MNEDFFSKETLIFWLDRIIIGCLHLLVIITPLLFTWINDELFEFNKMLLVYILAIIMSGAFVCKSIALYSEKFFLDMRFKSLDIPIGIFLISQAIATITSMHPYTSWWGYYSRFNGGLASLIAYSSLYVVITRTLTKKQLPTLLISLMIGLLLSSGYAFPEHFGASPSCLIITGEFSATCWRQDVQHRVFGTFGQPNWLAAYIVALFPIALSIPSFAKNLATPIKRIIIPLSVIAGLMAYPVLIFTKSRSGFLGFVISLAVLAGGWAMLYLYRRQTSLAPTYIFGWAVALIFISLVFGTPYTPSFSQISQKQNDVIDKQSNQEIETINRLDVGGTDSGEIRKIVWTGAVDVWRRYPMFGSGLETFAYSYYQDRPLAHNMVSEWDFLYNKAHNEFLNTLATTGTAGLLAYAILIGWFIAYTLLALSRSTRLNNIDTFALLLALVAGFIGVSITNFFGFSTVMVMTLMYIIMAMAVVIGDNNELSTLSTMKINKKGNGSHKVHTPLSTGQLVLIAIIIFIALAMLLSIRNRWQADYLYAQGKAFARTGHTQAAAIKLTEAITLQPQEAVFYDELATVYANLAIRTQSSQTADQLARAAIEASDIALELNPVHLNFYKTRGRIFLLLSEYNPAYLTAAAEAISNAFSRAPTDAKLAYNLALIYLAQGDVENGIRLLDMSIEMKPNYEAALLQREQLNEQEYEKEAD